MPDVAGLLARRPWRLDHLHCAHLAGARPVRAGVARWPFGLGSGAHAAEHDRGQRAAMPTAATALMAVDTLHPNGERLARDIKQRGARLAGEPPGRRDRSTEGVAGGCGCVAGDAGRDGAGHWPR